MPNYKEIIVTLLHTSWQSLNKKELREKATYMFEMILKALLNVNNL